MDCALIEPTQTLYLLGEEDADTASDGSGTPDGRTQPQRRTCAEVATVTTAVDIHSHRETARPLAEVHAALAHYYDHQAEIERDINEGDAFVKALRNSTPSKLAKRLAERRSG
jgi:hypothetical protein